MAIRIVLAAALLSGCSWLAPEPETVTVVKTVEVAVPYREPRPDPPEPLATPYRPESLPVFVPPSNPDASIALTPEGAERLRVMLRTLKSRDESWRAWSMEPP